MFLKSVSLQKICSLYCGGGCLKDSPLVLDLIVNSGSIESFITTKEKHSRNVQNKARLISAGLSQITLKNVKNVAVYYRQRFKLWSKIHLPIKIDKNLKPQQYEFFQRPSLHLESLYGSKLAITKFVCKTKKEDNIMALILLDNNKLLYNCLI